MIPLILAMSLLQRPHECADLSGKYAHAGEDNGAYVSIAQTQCERVVMTWAWDFSKERVPVRLVLDGRFQAADPRGFAGFRKMSASLNGQTLKISMTGQSPGDTARPYSIRYTLLADGDLCVTDGTGSTPYSRYSREHGEGGDVQKDAMRRSVQGCSVP
jgi:hypothetical protein